MPFDPIASKEAEKIGLKVVVIGKSLGNLKDVLEGKGFEGTVIE
jgi:uridylate kinase